MVAKDGDVRGITEDAVAPVAGGFLQDPQPGKASDEGVGGRKRRAGEFLYLGYGYDRTLIEGLKHSQTIPRCTPRVRGHGGPVLLTQHKNAPN